MADAARFDVVVFGATGFTGRLVVEYFVREAAREFVGGGGRQARRPLSWAIAARDADKLAALKLSLKHKLRANGESDYDARIDAIPVLVADGTDRAAVARVVASSRVVVSLAGPYARYSALLVELCAQRGVHYCDLTAEMPWAARNAAALHDVARESGARLVHCCGFEAVPSDLMTFLLADCVQPPRGDSATATTANAECRTLSRVHFFWNQSMGGASGGTIISLLTMLDDAAALTKSERRALASPYLFTPREYAESKRPDAERANHSTKKIPYDRELRARSAFFFTGLIDQQVVLRSNYLLGDRYGAAFAYVERMSLASGMNWLITAAMATFAGLAAWKWTRKLLWKLGPASGCGPSEAALQRGYFSAEAHAYDETGVLVASGAVAGEGDPGYLITSKLVSEVAFCLASDESLAGDSGGVRGGGVLTPATACGHALARRLNEKKIVGIRVEPVKREISTPAPAASA